MNDASDPQSKPCEDAIVVRNEFAEVYVRKVPTRKGERLEVHSPKAGFSIRLDALALEGLTWQDPETISGFLENPHGPTDPEEVDR